MLWLKFCFWGVYQEELSCQVLNTAPINKGIGKINEKLTEKQKRRAYVSFAFTEKKMALFFAPLTCPV